MKTERSSTRYISDMKGLLCPERLTVLKLYYLQHRRDIYIIIYVWIIWSVKFQTSFLLYVLEHLIVEEEHVLHHTLVLEDWEQYRIITLDDVPSVCSANYPYSYVIQMYVLFIVSIKKWDLCLSTVSDISCQPGFNNSLDHGYCLRWRTPRDGLAG